MSCIEEIVRALRENRVQETTFVYKGAEYSNRYGNYTRNRKPISKEEYHNIRKKVLALKDEEGSIEQSLNIPYKQLASKIEDLHDFIDNLVYDEEYEVVNGKRGHIERLDLYDEDARVSQIIEDTGMTEEEAIEINDILIEYTSTNNYKRFSKEDRELLDEFLEKSPVYFPPPIYRGLGFREKLGDEDYLTYYNELSNIDIGSLITFRDYVSFSSNPDVAVEFAYTHGDYQVYIVNTKNLTGVSIDHLSSIEYREDEILYKSDVRMRVQYKEILGDTVYLHVEEVALEEDNDEEDNIVEIPIVGGMYLVE